MSVRTVLPPALLVGLAAVFLVAVVIRVVSGQSSAARPLPVATPRSLADQLARGGIVCYDYRPVGTETGVCFAVGGTLILHTYPSEDRAREWVERRVSVGPSCDVHLVGASVDQETLPARGWTITADNRPLGESARAALLLDDPSLDVEIHTSP